MTLDKDLDLITLAFAEQPRRQALEAAQRMYEMGQEVDDLHRQLLEASNALLDAGSVTSTPVENGIRQLLAEREELRGIITLQQEKLSGVARTFTSAKVALIDTITGDHPWLDEAHCERCKALHQIEDWRNDG